MINVNDDKRQQRWQTSNMTHVNWKHFDQLSILETRHLQNSEHIKALICSEERKVPTPSSYATEQLRIY